MNSNKHYIRVLLTVLACRSVVGSFFDNSIRANMAYNRLSKIYEELYNETKTRFDERKLKDDEIDDKVNGEVVFIPDTSAPIRE